MQEIATHKTARNKISIGIKIIGCGIVVISTCFLLYPLIPVGNHFTLMLIIGMLIYGQYPGVVPFEFPYFFNSRVEHYIDRYFLFCWFLPLLLCGVGILWKRNTARITLLILSFARLFILITSIFVHPLMPGAFSHEYIYSMSLRTYIFSAIFPIFYIIFFTHPKVKKQFK